MAFEFEIIAQDGNARAGILHTPHGSIETPVFAPVGTQATVKAVPPRDLEDINASLVLANTYHLHLRPGSELIQEFGGLHHFMRWNGPILTDSGGFQVFSLSDMNKIDDDGVTFRSHHDGSKHRFTPEVSMGIQQNLGADIIMAFDECPKPDDYEIVTRAVSRTSAWAARSREAHPDDTTQALFGIQQGGIYEDQRAESTRFLTEELDFPGYAVGGLAVGETKQQMYNTLDFAAPMLPAEKPRYLMGVGAPDDLAQAVMRGIDMFDCVMPTRIARHGSVFTHDGRLNMGNAEHIHSQEPMDPEVGGYPNEFTKGYIRHLVKTSELLGHYLLSMHNIMFLLQHMQNMRQAIIEGRLESYTQSFLSRYFAA
ncbi:MAG: tRNA guanosine(34) transglycosylase Tgt [Chloroflexota bacterium]